MSASASSPALHRLTPHEPAADRQHRPGWSTAERPSTAVARRRLSPTRPADGGRQILGFATPGDLLDLSGLFTGADHEVRALGPCEIRQISAHEVRLLIRRHPSLLAALCRVVMLRVQRNWIVGLGRRTALARTANLLCEIYARQAVAALALNYRCPFPALQSDIADALGLSAVHTHRVLRTLTKMGLATVRDGQLTNHDWDGLAALAEFDPEALRPLHDPRATAAAQPAAAPAMAQAFG